MVAPPIPRRRNSKGQFSKRGQFIIKNHSLIPLKPGKKPQRPPSKPRRDEAPPAPPAPTISKRPTSRSGAKYSTWFRAAGTFGPITEIRGGDSPELLDEAVDEYAVPVTFLSNHGAYLGQVKFKGIVPLEMIIDKLNSQLQFAGEETPDFDFRRVYPRWSYRYQVIETIGPTSRPITEFSDSRPRRGRK